jgi:hypothetical protein
VADDHDRVPAELLQRSGVAAALVQVHGELGRHVERRREREVRVYVNRENALGWMTSRSTSPDND